MAASGDGAGCCPLLLACQAVKSNAGSGEHGSLPGDSARLSWAWPLAVPPSLSSTTHPPIPSLLMLLPLPQEAGDKALVNPTTALELYDLQHYEVRAAHAGLCRRVARQWIPSLIAPAGAPEACCSAAHSSPLLPNQAVGLTSRTFDAPPAPPPLPPAAAAGAAGGGLRDAGGAGLGRPRLQPRPGQLPRHRQHEERHHRHQGKNNCNTTGTYPKVWRLYL